MVDKRLRRLVQRGEYEPFVTFDMIDPLHVVLRIVDAETFRIALAVRHGRQRSIRPEYPGMVGATEQAAGALIHHAEPRAAMRAAVLQHVNLSVGVPGDLD